MPIVHKKPVTPSQRFHVQNKQDVSKKRPERKLSKGHHRKKGRNAYGRITSRRRGGGHKRLYRTIDFKRNKVGIPATVKAIEYDPNRSANLALLFYADGEKSYILAPNKLKPGDTVISSDEAVAFNPGNAMPLSVVPPSTRVHAIEMQPGSGAKLARSAGVGARLIGVDGDRATLKMPSGEIRMVNSRCRATIGTVGNGSHQNAVMGKAGRNRWKGRRPRVRGVAMNPVDHPMGGGEGRTSGGGHPRSPWGQLSKGYPTRKKSNPTNALILVRRNGRKLKG
jgi:large subunit ribosomal protein L2